MNNIILALHQFAQNQKLCAVYFKSPNGLSSLQFHYLVNHKGKLVITNRVLNDEKFFKYLYKSQNTSRNQLLIWIHSNIPKERYIHEQGNVDIIITKEIV